MGQWRFALERNVNTCKEESFRGNTDGAPEIDSWWEGKEKGAGGRGERILKMGLIFHYKPKAFQKLLTFS